MAWMFRDSMRIGVAVVLKHESPSMYRTVLSVELPLSCIVRYSHSRMDTDGSVSEGSRN